MSVSRSADDTLSRDQHVETKRRKLDDIDEAVINYILGEGEREGEGKERGEWKGIFSLP